MAIRTDADAPLRVEILVRRKNAVAEIGFGGQTQTRDRAAFRERQRFVRVDMRGVHEAPAAVDVEAIEQPLHRAGAFSFEAGVDFGGLLGDMDVNRRAAIDTAQQGTQRIGRYRTQ